MIYNVRLREILVHEFQVEAENLKCAFMTAIKKAHSKKLHSVPIGKFFEIESITQGKQNELTRTKLQDTGISGRFKKKGQDSQT